MVHVLKRCGDNLTRENVMKQAASIKDLELGGLLPGIKINTGHRLRADLAGAADALQGRDLGAVRRDPHQRRRRLSTTRVPSSYNAPAAFPRGFSFATIGWITRRPFSSLVVDHDRPTSPAARDLRCGCRGRASRRRFLRRICRRARWQGDLPRRRQGRGRDGCRRRTALSRHARARSGTPQRPCHHAPRPWRADAPHQGDRGRPSRA